MYIAVFSWIEYTPLPAERRGAGGEVYQNVLHSTEKRYITKTSL